MVSQPCPIWRFTWGIRSVIEGPLNLFFCSTFPREGSKVVGKFSDRASKVFRKGDMKMSVHLLPVFVQAGFVYPLRSPWGVSDLVDGLFSHLTARLAGFWGGFFLVSQFPVTTGDQKNWRGCVTLYHGVFPLSSIFLFLWQRRSWRDFDRPKGSQFSWCLSKILIRNAPQQRATSWEVCTFPSVSLISWQKKFQWYASLISDGILV